MNFTFLFVLRVLEPDPIAMCSPCSLRTASLYAQLPHLDVEPSTSLKHGKRPGTGMRTSVLEFQRREVKEKLNQWDSINIIVAQFWAKMQKRLKAVL